MTRRDTRGARRPSCGPVRPDGASLGTGGIPVRRATPWGAGAANVFVWGVPYAFVALWSRTLAVREIGILFLVHGGLLLGRECIAPRSRTPAPRGRSALAVPVAVAVVLAAVAAAISPHIERTMEMPGPALPLLPLLALLLAWADVGDGFAGPARLQLGVRAGATALTLALSVVFLVVLGLGWTGQVVAILVGGAAAAAVVAAARGGGSRDRRREGRERHPADLGRAAEDHLRGLVTAAPRALREAIGPVFLAVVLDLEAVALYGVARVVPSVLDAGAGVLRRVAERGLAAAAQPGGPTPREVARALRAGELLLLGGALALAVTAPALLVGVAGGALAELGGRGLIHAAGWLSLAVAFDGMAGLVGAGARANGVPADAAVPCALGVHLALSALLLPEAGVEGAAQAACCGSAAGYLVAWRTLARSAPRPGALDGGLATDGGRRGGGA